MRGDIIHAERVKSPSIGRQRTGKQDPNEQTTGRIMLELSDSMDEMTDLEWDNLAERIMSVFRNTAVRRGKVRTHEQKAMEVTNILVPIVYLNDLEVYTKVLKEIRKL